MGCLGVHFALTEIEVDDLCCHPDQTDRLSHLFEVIESKFFVEKREYLAQNDKAWDAMHRALTDGQLSWQGGQYPLNHVILGGRLIYTNSDHIMSLKSPDQVHDVAKALPLVTEPDFRRRYFAIDSSAYGFPVDETDFGYTWSYFQEVRRLFHRAASENLFVLFSATQ